MDGVLGSIDAIEANHSAQDLASRFRDIMVENEILVQENRLIQSYLDRHIDESKGKDADAGAGGGFRKKGRRLATPIQTATGLTPLQKYSIALEELSQRSRELLDVDHLASKEISDLTAMLGEAKIRVDELKREEFDFRRDVLGQHNTQRSIPVVPAEKVLKYYEDKMEQKTKMIQKKKEKTVSLKKAKALLEKQLREKEEQGDSLQSIDFHQLKIENTHFTQRIKERNEELLKLKVTTGKTVQVLNSAKVEIHDNVSIISRFAELTRKLDQHNLNTLVLRGKQYQQEITEREEALQRLTEELGRVENEVLQEEKKKDKFRAQISNANMPQVLDYVKQKALYHDLQMALKNWQRKTEITELALKKERATSRSGQRRSPFVQTGASISSGR